MILQRLRVNERDFYYSFLQQDASENTASLNEQSTVNANFYDIQKAANGQSKKTSEYPIEHIHVHIKIPDPCEKLANTWRPKCRRSNHPAPR